MRTFNDTAKSIQFWRLFALVATFTSIYSFVVVKESAAHHLTTAIYDSEINTAIEGRVVSVDFKNPHVYLFIESISENNQKVTWEIEGPPPAVLRRAGWTRNSIAIGDDVIVNGNPGRNTDRKIFLLDSLEIADGTRISLAEAFTTTPLQDEAILARATGLEGTWGTIFDMAENLKLIQSSDLELTEKGQSSIQDYVEVRDNPGLLCVPATAPSVMLVPDIKSIEIQEDIVLIRGEQEAMERTIYLNTDSHSGARHSIHGHSVGRWVGEELLIDTTHFSPHRQGNGAGLASGTQKHLVERLSLNDDGARITYSYELEDPEFLEGLIIGEIQWAYRPDLEFRKLSCDLDNAGRFAR